MAIGRRHTASAGTQAVGRHKQKLAARPEAFAARHIMRVARCNSFNARCHSLQCCAYHDKDLTFLVQLSFNALPDTTKLPPSCVALYRQTSVPVRAVPASSYTFTTAEPVLNIPVRAVPVVSPCKCCFPQPLCYMRSATCMRSAYLCEQLLLSLHV